MDRRGEGWDGEDRRGPPSLLVVGDDEGSNELRCRILRARGLASAASRPDDALGAAGELLPRCVVIDLAAGGIGRALTLLEEIRASGDRRIATARVVLVARDPSNRVLAYQAGADAFLVRPFHADELVRAVSEVLARPLSEALARRQAEAR